MVSRPWQSHAADAIDALIAYLNAAIAATGPQPLVVVHDGPWTTMESEQSIICVGWAGFPTGVTRPATQMQEQIGAADISSVGVQEGLGPSIMETLLIACAAITRDGTGNVSAARRLAYSNVNLVGQILASHQEAGVQQIGNIMQAVMATTLGLHQVQDRMGALAIVTFNIEARAYAQQ